MDALAYSATYGAMYLLGRLHLVARDVMLTNGCYTDAYLRRSPLDVEPPIFLAMEKYTAPPGAMCTQLMHRLSHAVQLDFAWSRSVKEGDTIVFRDRLGDHATPIKIVKEVPLAALGGASSGGGRTASGGGGGQPDPLALKTGGVVSREGIGYSNSYSLAEAIEQAMQNMQPRGKAPVIADWLSYFEVVSIGIEVGGIAGFNRMKVLVRTYEPSP